MPKTGMILVGFAVFGFSAYASWYGMPRETVSVVAAERALVASSQPVVPPANAVPGQSQASAPPASGDSMAAETESDPAEEASAIDPAVAARYDSDNADYPTLDMRLTEMNARRGGRQFDPEAVVSAVSRDSAWEVDDSIADELPLAAEDRTDGREFIRFDPLKVESLVAGDEMAIQIAQVSASYRMTVDRVQANEDGTVTWYGHLADFDTDNQVSLTRGESLTYGGIHAPEGHFVIEARDDKGWIVSGATLFKRHHDPIIPPESARAGS